MREMNEYTAEVIRRASAKKRRRMARLAGVLGASCAALVCAFGLAVMLRPVSGDEALPPRDHDDAAGPLEADGIQGDEYVFAEVTFNGEILMTASSPDEARAVADALEEAMNAAEAWESASGNDHGTADGSVHILLASANGRTEEYLLSGNQLYRHNTKESRLLPDEALEKLASILGVGALEKGE